MGEEEKKAAKKALALLAFQDRTEKELFERLCRAGFSEEVSQAAVCYVKSFGYINDRRYIENYIMFQQGKRSRKEIIYKLAGKGLSQELIEEVFEQSGYEGEEEAANRFLTKKLRGRGPDELSDEERRKICASLSRKGYSYNVIKKVFSNVDN